MIYKDLHLRPRPGDRYQLLRDYEWMGVRVPAGYLTNGANIPRVFWSVWPPNRPDYMPIVVIHDYLCDRGEYRRADRLLYRGRRVLGIGKVTATLWYWAVRVYHKIRRGR